MNYYHVQDTEIMVHRNGMEKRIFRRGTAERAGEFAEKFGKREWGYCCGMLHDIGKYSKEFQRKIQENTNERVDHATAGAQVCKEISEPIAFDKDKNMDFALGIFIRMLYSCLVDAEFLDTESFMKNGDTGRNSGESMEILRNRLNGNTTNSYCRRPDFLIFGGMI